MAYQGLAEVYDFLMSDISYDQWAEYITELLQKHEIPGRDLLDLGCGTGSITIPLAKKDWRIMGVDNSIEMLMQAREKMYEEDLEVNLICQDIRELTLAEEVDGVISTFDTFNYILDPKDLKKVFTRINQHLIQGGLIVFDLNSPYKLQNVLGNNTYTHYSDEVVYIWDNYFDEGQGTCQMDLTFFALDEETGLYERFEEQHMQKVYSEEMIQEILSETGFELVARYNQLTLDIPSEEAEKIVYVARKRQ